MDEAIVGFSRKGIFKPGVRSADGEGRVLTLLPLTPALSRGGSGWDRSWQLGLGAHRQGFPSFPG
jgi:hypothetical protein